MKTSIIKKLALLIFTVALITVTAMAAAETPWGPRQRQRHRQIHHLNHHIDRQYNQAARAAHHGHWWDAMWHWNNAQNMQQRRNYVQHQIHRVNRHDARNHAYCRRHHLYC